MEVSGRFEAVWPIVRRLLRFAAVALCVKLCYAMGEL